MFTRWILKLLLILALPLAANPLYLKERLKEAKAGDFIVTCQNNLLTLVLMREKEEETLAIEEISLPKAKQASISNWSTWIKEEAPFHTAWDSFLINLKTGEVGERYSFTQKSFTTSKGSALFSTLINLPFKPATRGRLRPPRIYADGNLISDATTQAFETRWPYDQSDLAGKRIVIYLPTSEGAFPKYLPFRINVQTHGKPHLRVIDSGVNLASPKPTISEIKKR